MVGRGFPDLQRIHVKIRYPGGVLAYFRGARFATNLRRLQ